MKRTSSPLFLIAALIGMAHISGCGKDSSGPSTGQPQSTKAGASNRKIVFIFKSIGQYSEACKKGAQQANDELKSRGATVDYLAPDKADVSAQIAMMEK